MFNKIMVVCTGNICRSPIAEGLLKKHLPTKQITSSGTYAVVGAPANPNSITVSANHGLDLNPHIAQQLIAPMLTASDLVLVLDQTHMDWILQRYPQCRGKVHKLGKWQKNADVADPYKHPLAAFLDCYTQIDAMVQDWLPRLK